MNLPPISDTQRVCAALTRLRHGVPLTRRDIVYAVSREGITIPSRLVQTILDVDVLGTTAIGQPPRLIRLAYPWRAHTNARTFTHAVVQCGVWPFESPLRVAATTVVLTEPCVGPSPHPTLLIRWHGGTRVRGGTRQRFTNGWPYLLFGTWIKPVVIGDYVHYDLNHLVSSDE